VARPSSIPEVLGESGVVGLQKWNATGVPPTTFDQPLSGVFNTLRCFAIGAEGIEV
jgi:hypothetical protein